MNTTTLEKTSRKARVGLVAAAVIGATLVWLIASLLGLDIAVRMDGSVQAISGATVVLAAAVASLGAWAVRALTERIFRNPGAWWITISVTVGVLSMTGPLTMATSATASAALVAMHVVPAVILIPGLARTGPRKVRGYKKYWLDPNGVTSTEAVSAGQGYGGAP